MIYVPYSEAKELINEADVLLFRGKSLFSWLIKRYSSGIHSHAAIAHRDGEVLECLEFREFKGGRSVNLKSQVEENPEEIDVFRPLQRFSYYNMLDGDPRLREKVFTDEVAQKISRTMMDLTGLPYGWRNIGRIAKHYLPFLRLQKQNVKDNDPSNVYVCSTAVVHAYRTNFYDPVPFLADEMVTPADLARSPMFKYLFTIKKDW